MQVEAPVMTPVQEGNAIAHDRAYIPCLSVLVGLSCCAAGILPLAQW